MVRGALRGAEVAPGEVDVVGDRLYTDMEMARASGAVAVLVLSGETRWDEAHAHRESWDITVENLPELGRLFKASRGRAS
jgi:ribonucleotide monophosphatase NagD (HAD superfamily)